MTATQDLLNRVRNGLQSGQREVLNQLASPLASGTTTVQFQFTPTGVSTGATLSIDLESMYVWSVDASQKTANVMRGYGGTTAASHSSGALMRVNPRFSDNDILLQINYDLADLSSPVNGLFQMKAVDLSSDAAVVGYDFPYTDVMSVYEVRVEQPGPEKQWVRLDPTMWRLQRNADTDTFTSGTCMQVFAPGAQGFDIRVVYKAPYSPLVNPTDDVAATTGLSAQAEDLPILGAQARLMAPREVKRNFTEGQGDARRAEEVPAGAVLNSFRGIQALRQARIQAEAARLSALYPQIRA